LDANGRVRPHPTQRGGSEFRRDYPRTQHERRRGEGLAGASKGKTKEFNDSPIKKEK